MRSPMVERLDAKFRRPATILWWQAVVIIVCFIASAWNW